MNATSVRHLSQMAQEGDQEALIWGETMEMIDVAEEDMTGRKLKTMCTRCLHWSVHDCALP